MTTNFMTADTLSFLSQRMFLMTVPRPAYRQANGFLREHDNADRSHNHVTLLR